MLNILVATDGDWRFDGLDDYLKRQGHKVETVNDVEEAIAVIRSGTIEFVITQLKWDERGEAGKIICQVADQTGKVYRTAIINNTLEIEGVDDPIKGQGIMDGVRLGVRFALESLIVNAEKRKSVVDRSKGVGWRNVPADKMS